MFAGIVFAIVFFVFGCPGKHVNNVTWAFLLAAISNLAIGIWIIVYISEIHPGNHVKIPIQPDNETLPGNHGEAAEAIDEANDAALGEDAAIGVRSDHVRMPKQAYIMANCVYDFVFFAIFLTLFILSRCLNTCFNES